jgi:hypothetical protein
MVKLVLILAATVVFAFGAGIPVRSETMPAKVLKERRSYHGSDAWWFAATAVVVLIAVFLFTLLVTALELRWGVIPTDTGVITSLG